MPSERFFTGNFSQECHPKGFLLATFHRNAIRKVFYWQLFTGMSSERVFTEDILLECHPELGLFQAIVSVGLNTVLSRILDVKQSAPITS